MGLVPGMGLCQRGVRENPPDHHPRQAMRPGYLWDPTPLSCKFWEPLEHHPAPNPTEHRAPSAQPFPSTKTFTAMLHPALGSAAAIRRKREQRAFSCPKLLAIPSSRCHLQRAKVRWLQMRWFSLLF